MTTKFKRTPIYQSGYFQNLRAAHRCIQQAAAQRRILSYLPSNMGISGPGGTDYLECARVFMQWCNEWPALPLP